MNGKNVQFEYEISLESQIPEKEPENLEDDDLRLDGYRNGDE